MEGGGAKQASIADGGQFPPCYIGRPFRAWLSPPPPPRVPNFNEGSLQTFKLRRSPPLVTKRLPSGEAPCIPSSRRFISLDFSRPALP